MKKLYGAFIDKSPNFFFGQSIGIDKTYRNLVASFAKGERFSRLPRLSNTRYSFQLNFLVLKL